MRHHIFEEAESYKIAILIKGTDFNKQELITYYVAPLQEQGIPAINTIAFSTKYDDKGKCPAKLIKEYLNELLPVLNELGVQFLYVADAAYYKTLAGQPKAEVNLGYTHPCKIKGFEHMQVVLGINHRAIIYNPDVQRKLDISITALANAVKGSYQKPGSGIIHSACYPSTPWEIREALKGLHTHAELTCDIETFSLQFDKAGIATISFAWDKHNGMAFACDYRLYSEPPAEGYHGWQGVNYEIRAALLEFFLEYAGKLTFHNASFDVKVIIYTLWMQNLLDTPNLLEGLEVMTDGMDDTKIIAYLATNSTAGNVLALKALAHEYAGNWAKEEINDVRLIPLPQLLEYNLIDALATWYVKDKYTPIMIQDKQENLYNEIMLPSLKDIIQMELTGLPMSTQRIVEVKEQLTAIKQKHLDTLFNNPIIKAFTLMVQTREMEKANAKLKVKQHPIEKFKDVVFNPNSGPQLQRLLYEYMQLPVIDLTDTKLPATGAETIEKLSHHTQDPDHQEVLSALIGLGGVAIILSTFIPAFERGIVKDDFMQYLHGCFKLGGAVSGRLSSADPNMQNIPAGSDYGKLIKSCFMPPDGWLFAGADFKSLEDYISALTTKDPNKLAVYEQGFDGHCLRAAYYFRDQCPHIDLEDPNSVNTIKSAYPQLRQDSKGPTFLLTYGGTYHGMMSNLGWPEDKAKAIEKGYHDLYQVSDAYVQSRLQQASQDGYVEVAFGLRVRTPLLKQVVFGSSRMPYEAASEGRTAGNALGQSYGLLNNRAASAFMKEVRASKYRLDIKLVALIHDAIYLLIRDNIEVVTWVNNRLIAAMEWQELPEIQHPTVKLGAELDIFWPDWSNAITLPNKADPLTILTVCAQAKEKYLEKKGK